MLECSRKDLRDTVGWKCSCCKTRCSVRDGSFFAKSHLTLQQWVMLLHFWSRQNPVLDTAECVAENSYWNRVFKTMKGVHSHQLPSYLDEFMWRERYGATREQAFDSILVDISLQYVV